MELHRLLKRQLNHAGFKPEELPEDLANWTELLSKINNLYHDSDQERYILERSMEISSKEFVDTNRKLQETQIIAGLGFLIFDLDTTKINWSKELISLFNFDTSKPLPVLEEFINLVHPYDQDAFRDCMKKVTSTNERQEIELRIKTSTKDDHWFLLIMQMDMRKDSSNKLSCVIKDINKHKMDAIKIKELDQQLLSTARRAGMSEVATNILHNIGNVLNSANVAVNMLKESMNKAYFNKLFSVMKMIKEHMADIVKYLSEDKKGMLIPAYLVNLCDLLEKETMFMQKELQTLDKNITHIKEIVSMQESISSTNTFFEKTYISELVESALQLSGYPFTQDEIQVFIKNNDDKQITTDKNSVLQVLINIIQNAKDALRESEINSQKYISISSKIETKNNNINFTIKDNGIGIKKSNLIKIFNYGFTTKNTGHGFGLHSSALVAKKLGGSLIAISDGPGSGAEFTLTLPLGIANEEHD